MCDRNDTEALDRWLNTATCELCDVAKERVENEIREHYAEAVEAELAQGQCEDDAHRIALTALGDAWKAGSAFRKTYLTSREAKSLLKKARWIRWLRNHPSLGMGLGVVSLFLAGMGIWWGLAVDPWGWEHIFLILASTICALTIIDLWVQPRLEESRQWRHAKRWCHIGLFYWIVLLLLFCISFLLNVEPGPDLIIFLMFLGSLGWNVPRYLSLQRRKWAWMKMRSSFPGGDGGGRYA